LHFCDNFSDKKNGNFLVVFLRKIVKAKLLVSILYRINSDDEKIEIIDSLKKEKKLNRFFPWTRKTRLQ